MEKLFPCIPQKGEPFVPCVYRLTQNDGKMKDNFTEVNGKMFGLDVSKVKPPRLWMKMSQKMKEKIDDLGGIEKVVLLAPEAKSYTELSAQFWERIAENKKKNGNVVLYNSYDGNLKLKNALPLSDVALADMIAIGSACKAVYALRSGLCDCWARLGRRLTVFYNSYMGQMDYYSLNSCYTLDEPVNEEMIEEG